MRGIPHPSSFGGGGGAGYPPPKHVHTCLPSLLQTPLTVFVGAMVTTGGVLGTLCPPGGTMMGPMGPRLGVLAGELWLVAGEETGDDSLLIEDPEIKLKIKISGGKRLIPPSERAEASHAIPGGMPRCRDQGWGTGMHAGQSASLQPPRLDPYPPILGGPREPCPKAGSLQC